MSKIEWVWTEISERWLAYNETGAYLGFIEKDDFLGRYIWRQNSFIFLSIEYVDEVTNKLRSLE